MRQDFRIATLMFVPYAVVTISTLGVTSNSDRPWAGSGAASTTAVPLAMQAAYGDCRRQHEQAATEQGRKGLVEAHRRDAGPRSQSPAWMQQRQGEIENCLRRAAGAAQPAAHASRAAARL